MNKLNSRQKKILEDIFKEPVKSDVLWKDIEKVLTALGAEISEGKGSRVRIYLNGIRAVFNRPHPGKQTDRGALKSMRRFLIEAGVRNVKI